jgi:hypothetical protein
MKPRIKCLWLSSLALCALLGCSDSTAPAEGSFQVIVAPDVIPATGTQAGLAHVTLRNTSRVAVAVDWCNISLELETSLGDWLDPFPPYNACIAQELAAQTEQTSFRGVGTVPRRLRFVYHYWFATPGAVSSSANRLTAYSNVFSVGP